ncbi:M50 family metallopeptidase [Qipengyuania sphaerica]|uniref:M50 family metallopeptidase n=1 Tax=Qipengyuania sphaerica TaxID=2867243 RepID=UPI0031E66085
MTLLVVLGFISILLWGSPWGGYLLYPFSILATWFHEMGHGLAAMAFGNDFERLVIFPDGSGYAMHFSEAEPSRFSQAMIAASGLLGPTFAGCMLILAARTHKATQIALALLGVALLGSTLIWVRSMTGWLVLPALGAISLGLAFYGREKYRRFAVQFLGVQGCISIYRDFGYLFSEGGVMEGRMQRSDTGYIADALFLPYWFWGAVITAMMGAMVIWSLKRAHRA